MSLSALEGKYLDATGGTIFSGDTEVVPILDGEEYFFRIYSAIDQTSGPGDVVFIVGWEFEEDFDLLGRAVGTPGRVPVGQLLANKAASEVDVRIVLSGAIFASLVFIQNPFKHNLDTAEILRRMTAVGSTTPPLAERVLFDFSGASSGSHHQKATIVKAGSDLVAFVGGMDYLPNRRDDLPHNSSTHHWVDGSRWGWHDAGVQLRGKAVEAVWQNFEQRWKEAATLPAKTYPTSLPPPWPPPSRPFNPAVLSTPVPAPPAIIPQNLSQSVQVMRSRFRFKLPKYPNGSAGTSWSFSPTGAIEEVVATLRKAIGAAGKFIYIEDQFLADSLMTETGAASYSIFPNIRAAAARDVKIIMVGSGKGDPGDPKPSLMNTALNVQIQEQILTPLAPPSKRNNVVVWRLENLTVHAKLIIIDDCFAAIGSANLHSRSMFGVDSELHVAIVDDATLVRKLRMTLWAEHLRIGREPWPSAVELALQDQDLALGIWRPEWLPATAPAGLWRTTGRPVGFDPSEAALALVGPEWVP